MPGPTVFTEQELKTIREGINGLRQPGAYVEGKWSVSSLNRRQDVVGGHFASKVILRDITLRTTEQMGGVNRSVDDRCAFLAEIVKTGVPEVMPASFGRNHTVEEMRREVATVKRINPECQVIYGGEAHTRDSIELAKSAGVDGVQCFVAPVELNPTRYNKIYAMAWKGDNWRKLKLPRTLDEQISHVISMLRMGQELGVKVSTGINMVPYATDDYIKQYVEAIDAAGGYEILLFDSPSGLGPEAWYYVVDLIRRHAPHCRVAVHAHNMFDLRTACSLAAARAGAEVIELSVNGYCSASGQADLAAVAAALTALYGVETGIKLERLTDLARKGEEFTGYPLAWNHAVTGRDVFNWGGTETINQERKVDSLLHWCLEPSVVGNQRRFDVTMTIGPYTMWDKLDALGIEVEHDQVESIINQCRKRVREQGTPVTDAQIKAIAEAVKSATAGTVR